MDPSTEARHGQIAALAATGMRQRQIARRMGCHFNTVYRALKRAEVQEHIEAMQAQVFERASELLAECLDAARAQAHEAWRAREEARRERRKERRSRAAPWQGQGTALAREDSSYDPYEPIRQALDQRQTEARPADLHQWAMQHAQAMSKGQALLR